MEALKNPQVFLLGIGIIIALGFLISRKKTPAGPVFTVPKEGGALQRLPKDEDGFISLLLSEKIQITHDTYIFRFAFPDPEMTFGL